MHLNRWLTAIVAIPLLFYIIGMGPKWLFFALLYIAAIVALIEFLDITTPKLPLPVKILCMVLALLPFWFISGGPFFMAMPSLYLWVVLPFVVLLFFYPSLRDRALETAAKVVLGLLYVCLPLALLLFIHSHPRGRIWIFFLLAVIFLSDTGGFYFGKFFGKHKLYPAISPGKTWEGAVGSVLSSLLAPVLFSRFFALYKLDWSIFAFTALLSLSGQIGDLVESMIKRNYGVKDSGKILPGHGGVLDRIDGLLFAIPFMYVFISWSIL